MIFCIWKPINNFANKTLWVIRLLTIIFDFGEHNSLKEKICNMVTASLFFGCVLMRGNPQTCLVNLQFFLERFIIAMNHFLKELSTVWRSRNSWELVWHFECKFWVSWTDRRKKDGEFQEDINLLPFWSDTWKLSEIYFYFFFLDFTDIGQRTSPPELPIYGDANEEISLAVVFPKGNPIFSLKDKTLQLLQPLDRDKENLSHIIFQVSVNVRIIATS